MVIAWKSRAARYWPPAAGVITYDRRGFGRSSKPGIGYNYDTFASDLDILLNTLNLTDVSLIGHSMGTGEITDTSANMERSGCGKSYSSARLGPTF